MLNLAQLQSKCYERELFSWLSWDGVYVMCLGKGYLLLQGNGNLKGQHNLVISIKTCVDTALDSGT